MAAAASALLLLLLLLLTCDWSYRRWFYRATTLMPAATATERMA